MQAAVTGVLVEMELRQQGDLGGSSDESGFCSRCGDSRIGCVVVTLACCPWLWGVEVLFAVACCPWLWGLRCYWLWRVVRGCVGNGNGRIGGGGGEVGRVDVTGWKR